MVCSLSLPFSKQIIIVNVAILNSGIFIVLICLFLKLGVEYEKIGVKFYLAHCRCKFLFFLINNYL